jgi:hypothetical protein
MKVLEMLAEGKISVADAERLIERLESGAETIPVAASPAGSAEAEAPPSSGKLKYLRVVVNSHDGDKVNIRVPLALVRTGLKLSTMIPEGANKELAERGIDLSQLSSLQDEELVEALRELKVDVDSTDGDTVRIFCE